jgi:hypothetical protein
METVGTGRPAASRKARPDEAGSDAGSTRAQRFAVRALLSRWRTAERRLADARPGSAEWNRARLEFDVARDAYLEEMDRARS